MIEHPITPDGMYKVEANRKNQIDKMRKANFKLPYQKDLQTEKSTYK